MITVKGKPLDISTLTEYSDNSNEKYILKLLSDSSVNYKYSDLDRLKFELFARSEIINAAIKLNESNMEFAVFRKATANPEYWNRTNEGGFRLKNGVRPSDAINDIFINGHLYATECATAMMIVYYKAMINILSEQKFNNLFSEIYLMNWHSIHPILREVGTPKNVSEILPGDRAYFANPDVDPKFPEWQGENVIVLPGNLFYGHGMGITTADRIIRALNKKRKPGATKSAYYMDSAARPNFNKLYKIKNLS